MALARTRFKDWFTTKQHPLITGNRWLRLPVSEYNLFISSLLASDTIYYRAFSGELVFREVEIRFNFSAAGTSSTAIIKVLPTLLANYEMLIDIAYSLLRSSTATPVAL